MKKRIFEFGPFGDFSNSGGHLGFWGTGITEKNEKWKHQKNASLDIVPRKFHLNFQSDRLNGEAWVLSNRQKIGMKIRVTHHFFGCCWGF